MTHAKIATLMDPLVSLIVLSCNQSGYVLETLESVRAQTYRHTELIIIDDCSTDNSVDLIKRWLKDTETRAVFVPHYENRGICKSLNEALWFTVGKYVSMIASDDIWLPDKLSRQIEIMERQPDEIGVLYSDAFQIDEHGGPLPEMFIEAHRKLPEMPQGRILDFLCSGNFIPGMTTLIRKDCFREVGTYDPNLLFEDWDMWLRIARRYSFLYSSVPSAKYRVHEKSLMHTDQNRIWVGAYNIALKHLRLGDYTKHQSDSIAGIAWYIATSLYERKYPEAPVLLLDFARQTGNRWALLTHKFATAGFPFSVWKFADRIRFTLRHNAKRLLTLGRRIFSKFC
jgi:glycosyltransferase involved in cell wall biosynthesis